MGINVNVYRCALGDSTNGGVSGTADQLCVVNLRGPFEPTGKCPAVMLRPGPAGSQHLVPAELTSDGWRELRKPDHVGPMSGGNFASSSDGRFSGAIGFYGAVAIHDRYESQELNDMLSR